MRLLYAYVRHFRNIYNQGFHFCEKYRVTFLNGQLDIRDSPNTVTHLLYEGTNISNIHILAGKTGSGKTNLLQLIGTDEYHVTYFGKDIQFFLLFESSDASFYMESVGMDLPQFPPHGNSGKIQSWYFKMKEGDISFLQDAPPIKKTLIINAYDKNAFLQKPLFDYKNRYITQKWLGRLHAPFQNTDIRQVCSYIKEYASGFAGDENLKRAPTIRIGCYNFQDRIDVTLDQDLMEKKYYRYETNDFKPPHKVQKPLSTKDKFIRNLWVDYCVYMRKQLELMEWNEDMANEDYDSPEAILESAFASLELIADQINLSLPKTCAQLAKQLDRMSTGYEEGEYSQIYSDIFDMTQALRQLNDKYFSLHYFEMPIAEMLFDGKDNPLLKLFECMDNYVPDERGLFSDALLPYEFTRLSSGEYQYALIFGILQDYTIAKTANEEMDDLILLLDEPESYMHPELARCFISKAVEIAAHMYGKCRLQLIISTHSPFLLSDVSSENITLLSIDETSGNCQVLPTPDSGYFGGNIHQILSDGFFMTSTIGEFSRKYLQKVANDLLDIMQQQKLDEALSAEQLSHIKKYEMLIPTIGEEILRNRLHSLLNIIKENIHAGN